MAVIYILEDDDNIREMVAYALTSAEFSVSEFSESKAFFESLASTVPSLLLLDIMLPGEDGISVLKKMKQSEKLKKIPLIMLTAKGAEIDRIKGLDLGADDYIIKPFSVMEVISRIKAVLRRCSPEAEKSEFNIGGIALNDDKHTVYAENEEVALTYKEFELLRYLMLNEDIVLSRDKILEAVWGFDYGGESRTVDMHIKSLRQKLGTCGDLIKTVRNIGYKIGV